MDKPTCDLCGDTPAILHLRGRCHLTAPLIATLEGDFLELRCYVPECMRLVAQFRVKEAISTINVVPTVEGAK